MITRFTTFMTSHRARILVLLAIGCMILSAYYFRPQGRSLEHYRPTHGPKDYYDPLAPVFLGAGALLLLAALWLARMGGRVWNGAPEHEDARGLNALHPQWAWLLAGLGVLLLWIMAEANGEMVTAMKWMWRMSPHVQFALLIGGIALLVIGLGGLPDAVRRVKYRGVGVWRYAPRGELALVLLLTLAALIVRFWNLGDDVTVMVDEGHFALGITYVWHFPDLNLLEPMPTSASFPFIFSYGQAFLVELFGRDFQGLRAFSALLGALTIPATYGLARELVTRRVALMAAILLLALPPHIHYSRLALNNIADPLFGVLALMFLARGLRTRHRLDYALSGVMLGFTQYFYEGGRILYPALIAGWMVAGFLLWRRKPSPRGLIVLALAFVLVAMPVYYTLHGRDFPMFDRMDKTELRDYYWSRDREENDLAARAARFRHSLMLYIHSPENTIFHYYLYYGGRHPMLLIYVVPLFLLGVVVALYSWRQVGALLLLGWLIGTSAGNALLVESAVTARYVVAFPAVALLVALGVEVPLRVLIHHRDTEDTKRDEVKKRETAGALALLITLALAVGQIIFYFGPFIDLFNVEVRAHVSHDAEDAIRRSVDFPPGTEVWIIGDDILPGLDAQRLMNFLVDDRAVIVATPQTMSVEQIASLPPGKDYAFFVAPTDVHSLGVLRTVFGDRTIQRTTNPDVPRKQAFWLFYVTDESRHVG